MAITITRDLNMVPVGVPPVIHLSQYDDDFSLVFNLYSSVGTFTVESSTTAEIRGTKEDGYGYSANATIDISNKRVTVAGNNQMTACAGQNTFELVLKKNNKVLSTVNFILDVERAALDAGTITDQSVLKELNAIIASAATATQAAEDAEDAADRAEEAAQTLEKTGDEISALRDDLSDLESTISHIGLSSAVKTALLACFAKVAWVDANGQDYYDDLEEALQEAESVVSISASFVQGSAKIYDTDNLDSIKQYLTVTATYMDQTSRTVTDYTLSGTLSEGTSTITVHYGGKTTTFNVTVTWGYKLKQTFTSTGSNKIDTSKKMTSGKYTLAIEFTVTSLERQITSYIVGNGISGNYVSLQCNDGWEDNTWKHWLWGYGIPWSNGGNLIDLNHVNRAVAVFNYTNELTLSITMNLKDVTASGSIKTFTNSYTHADAPAYNITIGDIPSAGVGLRGSVSKCIIEKGEWTSTEITEFLG